MPFAGWQRLTWVFQKRPGEEDGVGRLREPVRADGRVEVRWGDWSISVVAASSLTENTGGWDGLSLTQQGAPAAPDWCTALVLPGGLGGLSGAQQSAPDKTALAFCSAPRPADKLC